jgi:hypothetical protein
MKRPTDPLADVMMSAIQRAARAEARDKFEEMMQPRRRSLGRFTKLLIAVFLIGLVACVVQLVRMAL